MKARIISAMRWSAMWWIVGIVAVAMGGATAAIILDALSRSGIEPPR